MKKFITDLLDKENPTCAKTFIGIICGISLIVNMFVNPSDSAIYSVSILACGALAISGIELIKK